MNLRGDYAQHFNVNSVEFIETAPGTALRQPAEKLTHRLWKNLTVINTNILKKYIVFFLLTFSGTIFFF